MKKKVSLFFSINFWLILCTLMQAQDGPGLIWQDQGNFFSQSWAVNEVNASPQSFAITQDLNGVIYVGNASGIYEYDGNSWRRIKLPNQVTFSLACSETGIIYAGCQSDIGYLWPNAEGNMQYHSLLDQLPEEDRTLGQIWGTFSTPEGIYFQSFTHLIRWQPEGPANPGIGKVKIWTFPPLPSFGAVVRDEMYYFHNSRGLLKVEKDSLVLLPGTSIEEIANRFPSMYSLLPFPDPKGQKMLIGTQTLGLLLYDGKEIAPFESPANEYLVQNQLYLRGVALQQGKGFAFNTLGGGVILMDEQGAILQILDDQNGLPGLGALTIYQDHEDNLWLGQLGYITRVESPAPYTFFPKEGSNIVFAKHHGQLFSGGVTGIRYKKAVRQTGLFLPRYRTFLLRFRLLVRWRANLLPPQGMVFLK